MNPPMFGTEPQSQRPPLVVNSGLPSCLIALQVMFNHYVGTVEMEALCMIDMIHQQILPAMKESGAGGQAPMPQGSALHVHRGM